MRWLLMSLASILGVFVIAAGVVCLNSGCSSVGYYAQAAGGHIALLNAARPVPDWLADESTPKWLADRLSLSQRMRDFAVKELKLPDNASYRRYADLKRGAAVWSVVAAPELSLALKTWCFPVVGCVGYRGYFAREPADALAAQLSQEGWEASAQGIPAYSTLGALPGAYFADPLLNTFIDWPESELARLIFHELAHQIAYAKGDTMFNESFATAVERIGGQRWLDRAGPEVRAEHARQENYRQDFRRITLEARGDFDAIYKNAMLNDDAKRQAKAERMARLRDDYAALKAGAWNGYAGYDRWFARANNASLGVMAAYNDLVPQFERLFEREGRDFDRFYVAVQRIAALPFADRRAALDR